MICFFCAFQGHLLYAQSDSTGAVWPKWTAPVLLGGVPALSLVVLDRAWYSQYDKSPFHTFNDSREWMQMDKAGHAWTAYHGARGATALLGSTGTPGKKSVLLGAAAGMLYITTIELMDAYSARWGWSWPDVAANTSGILLFAAQEAAWGRQRVQLKFSAHPVAYEPELEARSYQLFGKGAAERTLKDYNGQTYWLSFRPHAGLPDWLQVSVGYGASGLLGGFANRAVDERGNVFFDRSDIPRKRQWYLAPDIDLTRIPVRKGWQRTALRVLNAVKFPAPALQYSNGKFSFLPLMF